MSVVKEYQYYISSKQRDTGTSSDFGIRVFPNISLVKQTNLFKITVVNATIPFSFSQVNDTNNIFYISYNSVTYPVQIPNGNYNIKQLNSVITSGIISSVLSNTGDTIVITIGYDLTTGKNTFTYNSGVSSLPYGGKALTLFAGSTISKMLGITTNIVLTVGQTVISNQKFDVNPILSLFIRSENLNQSNNIESILEKSIQSDILAEIQLDTNPGSYITWSNSAMLGVFINNKVIDRIQLYLSSTDDYVLSLNNLEWSVMLLIQEIQPVSYETDVLAQVLPPLGLPFEGVIDPEPLVKQPSESLEDLNNQLEELKNLIKKK